VGLPEQRLADERGLGAPRRRLDRGAQARAARPHDDHVVFVDLVGAHAGGPTSVRSFQIPLEQSRTYTSVKPTVNIEIHAHAMWCWLKNVPPRHASYLAPPMRSQEKQSAPPPTRWRSELQPNVKPARQTTLATMISVPRPTW